MSVMVHSADSPCRNNSLIAGHYIGCDYFYDHEKVLLGLAKERLLGFSLCIRQIRCRVLNMLTACLYSDSVFTPY
jgi:hypothetical protein